MFKCSLHLFGRTRQAMVLASIVSSRLLVECTAHLGIRGLYASWTLQQKGSRWTSPGPCGLLLTPLCQSVL